MQNEDVVEIYTLWNRLKKRFSLIRSQPKSFILGDTVIPVTNVDFALIIAKETGGMKNITAGGDIMLITVPTGKRWEISVTYMARGAGNFDLDQYLAKDSGVSIPYHVFPTVTGVCYYHPHPLLLTEGNEVGVRISNYVAPGAVQYKYWIKETNLEE